MCSASEVKLTIHIRTLRYPGFARKGLGQCRSLVAAPILCAIAKCDLLCRADVRDQTSEESVVRSTVRTRRMAHGYPTKARNLIPLLVRILPTSGRCQTCLTRRY
jgi:hypothetical protein